MNLKNKNMHGFTMIELIIVIAILGILAVFALPRFGQFTGNAKVASRDAVQASVVSAVGIAHAQWVSNGSPVAPSSVNLINGSFITMNAAGYPDIGTGATYADAVSCTQLANALLMNYSGLVSGFASNRCTINHSSWVSPVQIHPAY